MADLPGSSRLQLLVDDEGLDEAGLKGLASCVAVTEEDARRTSILPPPEDKRHTQFGIAGIQPTAIRNREGGLLTQVHWIFSLEWIPQRSPMDALLFTLDALRPPIYALPPELFLPALFVTHMAGHPRASVLHLVWRWAPLLDEMQREVAPLIDALLLAWQLGPSPQAEEARMFREKRGEAAILKEPQMQMLRHFAQTFGEARLDSIREASRPESALFRLFNEIGQELWQRTGGLLMESYLYALLPLGLWSSAGSPGMPLEEQCKSLQDLYLLWLEQGQKEEK